MTNNNITTYIITQEGRPAKYAQGAQKRPRFRRKCFLRIFPHPDGEKPKFGLCLPFLFNTGDPSQVFSTFHLSQWPQLHRAYSPL